MKVKELLLNTASLKKQKDFYKERLSFKLIYETPTKISFETGKSILSFIENKHYKPYHFAFNIPPFYENKALLWLKKRVKVIPFESNEIVDFSSWNARSIYFYDEDKNIVEFIARRNLRVNALENFSPEAILSISEVGIATENIEAIYNRLNTLQNIPVYDGDFNNFCAIGNDEGLFIVVNKDQKKWFPVNDPVFVSDFIIKGDYNFKYKNGKIMNLT